METVAMTLGDATTEEAQTEGRGTVIVGESLLSDPYLVLVCKRQRS